MRVVLALIQDEQKRILVTQRPLKASHGGFWELPGGKLEDSETAEQALSRELKEELGIEVQESLYLGEVKHQYPERLVHFIVFHVKQYQGMPACLEGQTGMKWLPRSALNLDDFPEGNQRVFELIIWLHWI